jgi:hypothetical protein
MMESSTNTGNGTIDELCDWVYYKETDNSISMNKDGTVEHILQNNPAITDVEVHFAGEDGLFYWAAAGASIGSSKHITSLKLEIHELLDSLDMKAFFGGLALNRSVKCLKICIDFGDLDDKNDDENIPFAEQVFKVLLPFFQLNGNLQSPSF